MSERRYWISFVEEYWPGQKPGTVIGRIEVHDSWDESPYATEEIRIATRDMERYGRLREHWDGISITQYHLDWLRDYMERLNGEGTDEAK